VVVTNSSPLIYLAPLSDFDLLPRLFGDISMPPAVWREVRLADGSDLHQRKTSGCDQECQGQGRSAALSRIPPFRTGLPGRSRYCERSKPVDWKLLALIRLVLSSRAALVAEILFLRKQLALLQERNVKPSRTTATFRLAMVTPARFFDWRGALVIVKPVTFLKWHRNAVLALEVAEAWPPDAADEPARNHS